MIDPVLGYTRKNVQHMSGLIQANVEACNKILDYNETERIAARKYNEKKEQQQRWKIEDRYNKQE